MKKQRVKKSGVSTLAAIARALNARNAKGAGLPPLLFLTDEKRTPDPLAVARLLPRGAGIVLRHYGAPGRARLAKDLARICRKRRLILLVAGDADLAAQIGADGVHLPERQIAWARKLRRGKPRLVITVSVHGKAALSRAAKSGASAALLGPVFATRSHPGQHALGVKRFGALARQTKLPVYALGGITPARAKKLARAQACGLAAIGVFLKAQKKRLSARGRAR